jgi:hypothetical protein
MVPTTNAVTRLNRFGDPLYNAQARRGYFAPMEGGESRDELHEALFSQGEIRNFPFALQTSTSRRTEEKGNCTFFRACR